MSNRQSHTITPAHMLLPKRLQWGITRPSHIEPLTQDYHSKTIAQVVLDDELEEDPNCGATLVGRWVTDWLPAHWIEIDAVPTTYNTAGPVHGPVEDPEAILHVLFAKTYEKGEPEKNYSTTIALPRKEALLFISTYHGTRDYEFHYTNWGKHAGQRYFTYEAKLLSDEELAALDIPDEDIEEYLSCYDAEDQMCLVERN